MNTNKELSPDSAAYRCSACHGDETWGDGPPIRGRAKSRSLSASPASGSTKEFRRTRSLHGPCPVTTFGPKACVLQNPQTIMHIQDPASQRLTWNKPPKSVLVIKKIRDARLLQPFKELCAYLVQGNNMVVYVEKKALEDPRHRERRELRASEEEVLHLPRGLRRHFQPDRLHHLPGGRRDPAVRLLAVPGQRASGHGVPPGLPGLPDPIQL